jgi:hypothetical protein
MRHPPSIGKVFKVAIFAREERDEANMDSLSPLNANIVAACKWQEMRRKEVLPLSSCLLPGEACFCIAMQTLFTPSI